MTLLKSLNIRFLTALVGGATIVMLLGSLATYNIAKTQLEDQLIKRAEIFASAINHAAMIADDNSELRHVTDQVVVDVPQMEAIIIVINDGHDLITSIRGVDQLQDNLPTANMPIPDKDSLIEQAENSLHRSEFGVLSFTDQYLTYMAPLNTQMIMSNGQEHQGMAHSEGMDHGAITGDAMTGDAMTGDAKTGDAKSSDGDTSIVDHANMSDQDSHASQTTPGSTQGSTQGSMRSSSHPTEDMDMSGHGIRGSILLQIDSSMIAKNLGEILMRLLPTSTLMIFVTMLLAYFLLQKQVITPIGGISTTMVRQRKGDREARAKPQPSMEFNDVAQSLNHMLDVLRDRENTIRNMALRDELTGLANRNLFHKKLTSALHLSQRTKNPFALMLLDLDKFKPINDIYGHLAGDFVLQEISNRLLVCTRKVDTVARLGGDEFAIILVNLENPEASSVVAKRILSAMTRPIMYEGKALSVGVSLGIASYPDDALDTDDLIQKSDLSLYKVKKSGRGNYHFYDAELDAAVATKRIIEKDLQHAIDRGEFTLNYQPIIDLKTGAVNCAEALIRWQHPTRGLISPMDFIPIAEANHLIGTIDRWVMEEACRQNLEWQEKGYAPFKIAVNVSSKQVQSESFPLIVKDVLASSGLKPEWLEIEITETMVMNENAIVITNLKELRSKGVGIAIDDFGTGYSSLGRLKHLPVNTLKIDKLFVDEITVASEDKVITEAIVGMAHQFNLKTVAEGVETLEQEAALRSIDCDQVQGYYYLKPANATDFEVWLEKKNQEVA